MNKILALILLSFVSVSFAQAARDPLFDEVEIHLDQLKSHAADVLFIEDYEQAYLYYINAKTMFNERESVKEIREELENSIYYITQINENIDNRAEFFSELLDARENGLEQYADKYASSDWIKAEELFSDAVEYVDDNDITSARELFPQIKAHYHNAATNAQRANELFYSWSPLQNANSELANILSPRTYIEGTYNLNQALDNLAEGDEKEDLDENLKDAKLLLEQSARIAGEFSKRYPGILTERSQAKYAGAENFALKHWSDAEKHLTNLGEMYEDGDYESVREEHYEAENLYTLAKHEAVKKRILSPAKNKIEKAYDLDADDLAPITMKESESLYLQGIMLVESDTYTEEEVQKTADQSIAYADLAIRITEIIKQSDADNPTWEKQILSWNTVPLELTNPAMRTVAKIYTPKYDPPITYEPENEDESFNDITDIFNDDEAEIKETEGMIVVSLIGLHLQPTQTNLNDENKHLVDKTINAINLFPNARITVVGHTDNASTKRFNKELSEKVANNIMEYIINNSQIDSHRLSYEGHGEDEPIADNTTYEGRMQNRRVDVIIEYL